MRAIVIDDSRAMRSIIRSVLQTVGFEVIEATDGAEGLRLLRETPGIDLACVDWNMPNIDGITLTRMVREDRSFDHVRIMIVTTETEAACIAQAKEYGADEYLIKPFTRDAMLETLRRLGMGAVTT
jgi:two-component system chemotaxis response regulator CheY